MDEAIGMGVGLTAAALVWLRLGRQPHDNKNTKAKVRSDGEGDLVVDTARRLWRGRRLLSAASSAVLRGCLSPERKATAAARNGGRRSAEGLRSNPGGDGGGGRPGGGGSEEEEDKKEKATEGDDEVPDDFMCPIGAFVMVDPVLCGCTPTCGKSFDRFSIERWVTKGAGTCPVTCRPLTLDKLYPNRNLRAIIEEWVAENGIPEHSAPPAGYKPVADVSAERLAASQAATSLAELAAAVVDPLHDRNVSDVETLRTSDVDLAVVSGRLASLRIALFEGRMNPAALTAEGQPGHPLKTLCKIIRGMRYPGLSNQDRENAAFVLRDAVKARGAGGGLERNDAHVKSDVVPLMLRLVAAANAPPQVRNASALILWDLCVEAWEPRRRDARWPSVLKASGAERVLAQLAGETGSGEVSVAAASAAGALEALQGALQQHGPEQPDRLVAQQQPREHH